MAKIPRQRTGSGPLPDRRRAVTYTGKPKKGLCGLILLGLLGGVAGLLYGAAELVRAVV